MPEILTRAGKGSDLTPTEADTNFKATARQVTTTTTLATSDNRGIVEGNHASTPFTITLPTVATAAGVDTGEYYTTITNIGAAVVSVDGNGSETINGSTDLLTLGQYSGVTIALNSAKTGWQITARSGDVGTTSIGVNPIYPKVSGTVTATTSGASHEYTSLPSWVTQIEITLVGNSTATSSTNLEIVIGDSGGYETTGYSGVIFTRSTEVTAATDAFQLNSGSLGAEVFTVRATLILHDSATNTWVMESTAIETGTPEIPIKYLGSKALSGVLTQVKLQTSGGGAFDAGSFNILYS